MTLQMHEIRRGYVTTSRSSRKLSASGSVLREIETEIDGKHPPSEEGGDEDCVSKALLKLGKTNFAIHAFSCERSSKSCLNS